MIEPQLVSIGLPTHNGARFIRESLESLLAQDYPNLEVVVSDNASTDGTPAILQEYGDRIRLLRQDSNIGAPANFNLVFRETRGALFMWAADDDRWEPSYVSSCVRALEGHPEAVLACSGVRFVDGETGAPVPYDLSLHDNPTITDSAVSARLRVLLARGGWYAVYGVLRRAALEQTSLFTNTYGADVILLVELAMQGSFIRVPETLFTFRVFAPTRGDDRGAWHSALDDRARLLATPYSHLEEACSTAVQKSRLSKEEKLRARLAILSVAYVASTPLRGRIRAEVTARLRMAIRDRRLGDVAKYGLLASLRVAYRAIRGLRRHPWFG